jgi:hypothetical protein
MRSALSLEPLEDRYLLSGVAVNVPLSSPPSVVQQEAIAHWVALYEASTGVEATVTSADLRNDVQRLLLSYPSLENRDGDSRREDLLEIHRDILFSSILSALNSPGPSSADGASRTDKPRSHNGTEPLERLSPSTDRIPGTQEAGGQRPYSLSGTDIDSPTGLNTAVFADWQGEPGLRGAFADGIILDAWSDAVPAPQADLVPASDRDLTTIAAYVVRAVGPVQTPEGRPVAGSETGLTDLIVGRTDLRSSEAATEGTTPSVPAAEIAKEHQASRDYPVADRDDVAHANDVASPRVDVTESRIQDDRPLRLAPGIVAGVPEKQVARLPVVNNAWTVLLWPLVWFILRARRRGELRPAEPNGAGEWRPRKPR